MPPSSVWLGVQSRERCRMYSKFLFFNLRPSDSVFSACTWFLENDGKSAKSIIEHKTTNRTRWDWENWHAVSIICRLDVSIEGVYLLLAVVNGFRLNYIYNALDSTFFLWKWISSSLIGFTRSLLKMFTKRACQFPWHQTNPKMPFKFLNPFNLVHQNPSHWPRLSAK